MNGFGPKMPVFSELASGIRRLLAPNPSMMTGPGTNTYLFGTREVAVLDPGPLIESHLDAIVETGSDMIRWILVTHTHPDHSPAAAELARRTGAELLGRPAPEGPHQDATFVPDRILIDGERLAIDGADIEVIQTPGHASNHICYRHVERNWIFTGDHVVDGSTVVIDPPDGNMSDYLKSLARLKAFAPVALAPGHGELINDPIRIIDWLIEHRLQREAKVAIALNANPGLTAMELVPYVYCDVDRKLFAWAERSLLAHLVKLEQDGRASRQGDMWRGGQDL
ncbi:MAG TPA: MBL fold metallo-hydrolase [Woeseiaceae bacterium]|nr:MBL fold metallo-hydrolase [Woeseiaceae bacterium]